jgi:hypothetical protein
MIDDPVFDPIFNYLEKNEIPVMGHWENRKIAGCRWIQ